MKTAMDILNDVNDKNDNNEIWSGCTNENITFSIGNKDFKLGEGGNSHIELSMEVAKGKTLFMKEILTTISRKYSPAELRVVTFCYEDYFWASHGLPHVMDGYAGEKDPNRIMGYLEGFAINRFKRLKAAGCNSISEYNNMVRRGNCYFYIGQDRRPIIKEVPDKNDVLEGWLHLDEKDIMPRIVIFIDDLDRIVKTMEESSVFIKGLNNLFAVSDELGIHFIVSKCFGYSRCLKSLDSEAFDLYITFYDFIFDEVMALDGRWVTRYRFSVGSKTDKEIFVVPYMSRNEIEGNVNELRSRPLPETYFI